MSTPINMSLYTHSVYRTDMALSIDPASGVPPSGGSLSPNPGNKVVAILWHQGEIDIEGGFPIANWAACVQTAVTGWRTRYGANIPFLAGTFSYAQQRYPASFFFDFLRFTFGGGRYGALGPSNPYYDVITTSSAMPAFNLPNLGLADAFYSAPSGGGLVPSVAPFDPATTIHFSVYGYQVMGARYAAAYAQLTGGAQLAEPAPPPVAAVPPPPPQPASPVPFGTLVFSHRVNPGQYNVGEYFAYGAEALYSPLGDVTATTHKARVKQRPCATHLRALLVRRLSLCRNYKIVADSRPSSQFSILANLSNYARYDGQFQLVYVVDTFGPNSDGTNFNSWVQTNNPATTKSAGNFTPIYTYFPTGSKPWAGLSLFNPAAGFSYRCTLAGESSSATLAFAVGQLGAACPYAPFVGAGTSNYGIATGGSSSSSWVQLYAVRPLFFPVFIHFFLLSVPRWFPLSNTET